MKLVSIRHGKSHYPSVGIYDRTEEFCLSPNMVGTLWKESYRENAKSQVNEEKHW